MAELSEIIKRMALEAMDGTKPVRAVMGQVVKANPLKVKISDKLTLTEDNLVVPESLTDHYIYIDIEKDERKTSYDIKIKDDSKKTKDELYYEVTCPTCGDTICLDEDLINVGEMECPNCGEKLEFDLDN